VPETTPPPPPPPGNVEEALAAIVQAINSRFDELITLLRGWQEKGLTIPIQRTITSINPEEIAFPEAAFSLFIVNDGPAVLEYRVPNVPPYWQVLNPTENITVQCRAGVINSLGLRVPVAGTTAAIRGLAVF